MRLTTVGRRSGQPREVMLTYLDHGQSFVVFASNSGEHGQPVWFLNLEANPEAVAQVGSQPMQVRARVAKGTERSGLWERIVEADPSYAEYQRRTERLIPVVILDRV